MQTGLALDLMLMDMNMPCLTGLEVLRALGDRVQNMYVVLWSAGWQAQEGNACGAVRCAPPQVLPRRRAELLFPSHEAGIKSLVRRYLRYTYAVKVRDATRHDVEEEVREFASAGDFLSFYEAMERLRAN